MGYYMALNPGMVEEEMEGIQTIEPAFGLEALWIPERQREKAELAGYTVVEAPAVLATHLMEVLKSNAYRILSREGVQRLLDILKQDQPTLVEELTSNLMTLGEVEKVLQRLLWERVPIRDLTTIAETLADYAPITRDSGLLTEYVRQALARTIVRAYQDEEGKLHVLVLDPEIERILSETVGKMQAPGDGSGALPIPSQVIQAMHRALETQIGAIRDSGQPPIVLCTPTVRGVFKQLMDDHFPGLVVLSYSEIPSGVEVQSIGMVRISDAT
jgi:flagellar biosynthesis protein FlhA